MMAIIPFSVLMSVLINVGHPSLSSMAFRKKSPIIRELLLLLVTFNQRILRLHESVDAAMHGKAVRF